MNRCHPRLNPAAGQMLAAAALLGTALLLPAADAHAQRIFPNTAKRGEMKFENMRDITINGLPETLAVGAQVRDEHNRIPLSAALRGKTFVVNYVRDPSGKIQKVWLLTEREAAREGKQESALSASRGAQWRQKRQVNEAPADLYRN